MSRPDWDVYFLNLAKQVAERATCRHKVGGVVVRENRVLLTGYNGSPPGQAHCTEVGCDYYWCADDDDTLQIERYDGLMLDVPKNARLRCKRTVHAEQNIVGIAAREGVNLRGATWYIWPFGPCHQCQMLVSTTELTRIVFPDGHHFYSAASLLESLGVQVDVVSP